MSSEKEISLEDIKLLAYLAYGVSGNIERGRQRVKGLVANEQGKYRVLGVDKFDGEDFVAGEFKSAEEALNYARRQTSEAKKYASDSSIATVYYAYDPQGNYLGGDTWVNE